MAITYVCDEETTKLLRRLQVHFQEPSVAAVMFKAVKLLSSAARLENIDGSIIVLKPYDLDATDLPPAANNAVLKLSDGTVLGPHAPARDGVIVRLR